MFYWEGVTVNCYQHISIDLGQFQLLRSFSVCPITGFDSQHFTSILKPFLRTVIPFLRL
jgi:hypothetical protein